MPQATATRNPPPRRPLPEPSHAFWAGILALMMAAAMLFVGADVFRYFHEHLGRPWFLSILGTVLIVSGSVVLSRIPMPEHPYAGAFRWSMVVAIIAMSTVFASFAYLSPMMENPGPSTAERAAISGLESQLREMDAQIAELRDRAAAYSERYRTRKTEIQERAATLVDDRAGIARELSAAVAAAEAPETLQWYQVAFRSTDAAFILLLRLLLEIAQIAFAGGIARLLASAAPAENRRWESPRFVSSDPTRYLPPKDEPAPKPEPYTAAGWSPRTQPEPPTDPPPRKRKPSEADAPAPAIAVGEEGKRKRFRMSEAAPAPAASQYLGMTPRDFLRMEYPAARAISQGGTRKGPYVVWADPKTQRVRLGAGPNSMDAYRDAADRQAPEIERKHGERKGVAA